MLKRWLLRGLIGTVVVLAAAVAAVWAVSIRMPGASFAGPLPPLSPAADSTRVRLEGHVTMLGGTIGERNVRRRRALDSAAVYVEAQMVSLGLTVRRQTYTIGTTEYVNIEGTMAGTSGGTETVVVGAHYDSAIGTPGADDNATGVACMLEVARVLREAKPARSVRFVAFPNEEEPYFWTEDMGSLRYAREARARNDSIVAMLSLEALGFHSDSAGSQQYPPVLEWFYPNRGDFVAFVGNIQSRALVHRAISTFRNAAQFPSQGSAAPAQLPGIGWSDQWSFWQAGYSAIMITDTAPFRNPHYHLQSDLPGTIDFARLARVTHGVAAVVQDLASNGKSPR